MLKDLGEAPQERRRREPERLVESRFGNCFHSVDTRQGLVKLTKIPKYSGSRAEVVDDMALKQEERGKRSAFGSWTI